MKRKLSSPDESLMDIKCPGYHTDVVMKDAAFDAKIEKLWAQKRATQAGQVHAPMDEHRHGPS